MPNRSLQEHTHAGLAGLGLRHLGLLRVAAKPTRSEGSAE
jgi:hypothetical protein